MKITKKDSPNSTNILVINTANVIDGQKMKKNMDISMVIYQSCNKKSYFISNYTKPIGKNML